MFVELNLATQPFRNRTLPWLVAVLVATASTLALITFIAEARQISSETASVERDLSSERAQAEKLKTEAAVVKAALTPGQSRMLDAAHLLVNLKRFSWTRLYSDLEKSLPPDLRIQRIAVRNIAAKGLNIRAELEMSVVGHSPADLTSMVSDMEREGAFAAELLTENPQTGRGQTGTEATLRVIYTQRLAPASSDIPNSGVASRMEAQSREDERQ